MPRPAWARPIAALATLAAVAALTATAPTAAAARPAPPAPDLPGVRAALRHVVDAGAPGAFAVIRDHGARERQESSAVGRADLDGTPMNPAWRFRAGSVTKMFTTVLVLRLAEQGRIDLDRPLRDYLPRGLLPEERQLTARQAMQHRAGLYDHADDLLGGPGEETTEVFDARVRHAVHDPRDLVALSVAHGPQFPPGTDYAYSNTGFVLMGLAVEHLTGRPYAEVLREEILAPLRLRQTSFVVPEESIDGPHITGYLTPDGHGRPLLDATEQTASWIWSAGAVISTAADLDRFLTALLTGTLLTDGSLRQMTAVLPTAHPKVRYGLGLRELALSCGPVLGHSGVVQGYQNQTFATPDGTRTVVTFANASNNDAITEGLKSALEPAFCGRPPGG
ncbi:serine hydrolase domain-containing protein [Streptomyces gamaensis]|uniref:Serine hydrolase domain-containing protein n=1 Tax=Streptomyces gamaensis TaxID=1763542 RepID=A0ABW0YZW7_9ACTN